MERLGLGCQWRLPLLCCCQQRSAFVLSYDRSGALCGALHKADDATKVREARMAATGVQQPSEWPVRGGRYRQLLAGPCLRGPASRLARRGAMPRIPDVEEFQRRLTISLPPSRSGPIVRQQRARNGRSGFPIIAATRHRVLSASSSRSRLRGSGHSPMQFLAAVRSARLL